MLDLEFTYMMVKMMSFRF